MHTASDIAALLEKIGAVTVKADPQHPFVWTSGIKAPIYCDNRLIMSYPKARGQVVDAFITLIQRHFKETALLAGTATAGIPHAAFIAQKLDLPMVYVRSSAKGHGKQNAIEGHVTPGSKVLMVEDLISTGGSVLAAAEKIQKAGAEVLGVVAVFNYELAISQENFKKAGLPLYTLTNFSTLIHDLAKRDQAVCEAADLLLSWSKHPETWPDQI